jgi:hypothetical protein
MATWNHPCSGQSRSPWPTPDMWNIGICQNTALPARRVTTGQQTAAGLGRGGVGEPYARRGAVLLQYSGENAREVTTVPQL